MLFLIWSSLIVITDEGCNPETGWLRSYLVCVCFCIPLRYNKNCETPKEVIKAFL